MDLYLGNSRKSRSEVKFSRGLYQPLCGAGLLAWPWTPACSIVEAAPASPSSAAGASSAGADGSRRGQGGRPLQGPREPVLFVFFVDV